MFLLLHRRLNSACLLVSRGVREGDDAAFPGADAGGSGQLAGHQAGDLGPADRQATDLWHHHSPGGHQPHREAVGPQVQVDVSEKMLLLSTLHVWGTYLCSLITVIYLLKDTKDLLISASQKLNLIVKLITLSYFWLFFHHNLKQGASSFCNDALITILQYIQII